MKFCNSMTPTTMIKNLILPLTILSLATTNMVARENIDMPGEKKSAKMSDVQKVMTGCQAGSTQTEIKLNNVRTRMLTSGDMWWDLSNAKYEVPKGSNSYSCFAGSLWFGGKVGGQLRVSAMTYRQSGVDFWPGPLDPNSVDIDATTCAKYDKHWRFNRVDVDKFHSEWLQTNGHPTDPFYQIPNWIKEYPGNAPSPTTSYYSLAPFYDANNDMVYDYAQGDYPAYNITGAAIPNGQCKKMLFGDETLFWVFNDKGNLHSESDSQGQIGAEIRAQAFEFATSDELNDMTFYNFEIINRSTNKLDSTYFAVWVDSDLGNFNDDYIGCDVSRGLGYIYNGDNYDEDYSGQTGYHAQLPALGCDFFQGPDADLNDGVDNDRDGCTDCTYKRDSVTGAVIVPHVQIDDEILPEQIIMARFSYYDNTGHPQNGNPGGAGNGIQFYNLMRGLWKDGTPMTYGGNGINPNSIPCLFMFPDNTDPTGLGTGGVPQAPWTEVTANNSPNDRRFLQSAGQFTLQPGAVNYITFGMPWVRTTTNNNIAAIPALQQADDKAQALFDQCFKVLDGPDAPDMTIQELENELIIYMTNKTGSNNYEQKRYHEIDVTIPSVFPYGTNQDSTYKYYDFEGYMVYQLKDATVSQTDLDNNDKARLIFQCDVKNGVSRLINYINDPTLGTVPKLMTPVADDKGILNSFRVREDQFAEGAKRLVNHKTYYFMAIAYAYNNFLTYKQDVPPTTNASGVIIGHPASGDYMGQKKSFLRGRKNIKSYSAIPHNVSPEAYGSVMNSYFGYGPKITRIEGQGNGGYAVDLTQASIDKILNSADNRAVEIEYENARGPVYIKVIDPLNVCGGDFILKLQKGVKDNLGHYQYSTGKRDTSCLTKGGLLRGDMRWTLTGTYKDKNGSTHSANWTADVAISVGEEQIFTGVNGDPVGFSATVVRSEDPQKSILNQKGEALKDDFLESSLTFSGPEWLTGVRDNDASSPFNWIRSGTEVNKGEYNDVTQKNGAAWLFADRDQIWENVVGGTWAPFRVCAGSQPITGSIESAPTPVCPSFPGFSSNNNLTLDTRNLASVDIVLTADKTKWSRCPVIELCHKNTNAVGGQYKFFKRKSPSVDKNGMANPGGSVSNDANDPNYIATEGMGWFPGYAINVETGERLNIAFGENSFDVANNGADMMWNPTSVYTTYVGGSVKYVFGGMHYIYVFGHNSNGYKNGLPIDVDRYDAGVTLQKMLSQSTTGQSINDYAKLVEAYKDAMWVSLPLTKAGYTFTNPENIPGDAKVRIRVRKPLRYGQGAGFSPAYSEAGNSSVAAGNKLTYLDSVNTTWNYFNPASYTIDTLLVSQNGNFPMYKFSTWDMVTTIRDKATAKDALSLINVVPNPYYGHSAYEKQRIDNYIKIVNLPPQCTIRIYTVNGTLVRTLKKDTDVTTDVLWDLKNSKNISIASGLYIIHVDVPGVGEKILKWFGVMRQLDLQSY